MCSRSKCVCALMTVDVVDAGRKHNTAMQQLHITNICIKHAKQESRQSLYASACSDTTANVALHYLYALSL